MFQLKMSQKTTRKLSKNNKFVTNETKICLFYYSFIISQKLSLTFQLIVFISHVILSENLLNKTKKIV